MRFIKIFFDKYMVDILESAWYWKIDFVNQSRRL